MYSTSGMHEGGFLAPNQKSMVINSYGELVSWITNSKGFRSNREFSYSKPNNTLRILSIGDSFTAGYRVGQSEHYSAQLEDYLNKDIQEKKCESLVACTENPVMGIKYLNEHGLKYQPDIVLLGITLGNDLTQTFINLHPFGRHILNGSEISTNPNFDGQKLSADLDEKFPEMACDYSFRLLDWLNRSILYRLISYYLTPSIQGESIFASRGKASPYLHDLSHGLGLFLKQEPASITQTHHQFKNILQAYKALAIEYNFDLKIILFPQRYQVNPSDLAKTVKDYGLAEKHFDWEIANEKITKSCDEMNIDCIDLLYSFRLFQNHYPDTSLYLPLGDMHWNKAGHRLAAEQIHQNFLEE